MFEGERTWCEPADADVDFDSIPWPDYDDDAESDIASRFVDERWSELEPSGLTMDLLMAVEDKPLTDDQSLEAIAGWEKLIAFAQAAQLRHIARFAALRPGEEPGTGIALAADEIAAELQLTRVAANNRLALARALTERLPATLAALSRGDIDLRKAQVVCDETWPLTDEQAGAVEARVLERAAGRDVSTVTWWRATLRREVLKTDPAGAQRRHDQRRTERRVVLTPAADGMAELWALLPAPEAVAIYSKLGGLARRTNPGDDRTMDQRRADCLVDLLLDRSTGRMDVQVQVTVAATTLMGLDELPGELVGYGSIPASQARELAADGTWRRLLTDPASGTLLDYGRKTYRPPKALADHVRARDRFCIFPGCRQPAEKCDLDHGEPYPEGCTADSNLAPECRHHHLVKTRGEWTVSQSQPGVFDWRSPTGRNYRVTPEPLAEVAPPAP